MVNLILAEEDVEGGGKSMGGIKNDFAFRNNVANATVQIRLAFIRKVYSLLTIQIILTIAVAASFMISEPMKLYVRENAWPHFVSLIAYFGIFIALIFLRRKHPINLYLLAGFTVAQACMLGMVLSIFDYQMVLMALFITLTIVLSLTVFTFQSKWDFSVMHSGCFAALWILIIGGFMQFFIQNELFNFVLCIGGALVFSLFIIVDTHLLMNHTSPEEYILATINLYLDIVNLFLYILRILSAARN